MVLSKLRKLAKFDARKTREKFINDAKSKLYDELTDFEENDITRGLIPIGDTGLYRTPDEPADPEDCARYPDSPFCGGNPINDVPFNLEPEIINTSCDLGIQLNLAIAYIKFPPVALLYRKEQCRGRKYKDAKPFADSYPNGQEYECIDASLYEASGRGNAELAETRKIFKWNLVYRIPGFYVKPGERFIMTAWLIYYHDCRWNLHQWHNTYMLDRPHPTIPLPNEDDKYAFPLVELEVYRNEDLYQTYEEYQVFIRERGEEFFGHDGYYWYKEGRTVTVGKCFLKVQNRFYVEYPPLFRLPVRFLDRTIFFDSDNCYAPFQPPPPPKLEEDCCMKCCRPYDDTLLKLLLVKVNKLSEVVGVSNYPLETEPPINTVAEGITELITRESATPTELDLTEIQNKLNRISDGLGVDSYPRNLPSSFVTPGADEPPVSQIEITNLSDLVKWFSDRYLEMTGGLGIPYEVEVMGIPAEINLVSATDVYRQLLQKVGKSGSGNGNTDLSEVLAKLNELRDKTNRLSEVVGVEEFPADVPSSFISVAGLSLPNMEIPNLTRLLGWFIERFDEIVGQFEIPIQIKDSDLTTEGDQSLDIKLPNIAEAIAEIVGLQLQTSINTELLVSMCTRTLIETGQDKQQNFKTTMMLDALCDYIGFEQKEVIKKMPLSFDPSEEENLAKLLKEKEIEVHTIECSDKTTFKANILDLLQAAAIIRAVHWRKIDPKSDIKQQLKDYILNQRNLGKEVNKSANGEDFDQFLEKVEMGFTGEVGTSIKKPYGRDLSERPRIRKIGEQKP